MSYADRESSIYDGAPVELYQFSQGLQTFEYTSGDKPHFYQQKTYIPEAVSRTEIDQSQEDHAGSITISLPRDNIVARLFISYLPVAPVKVRVLRFHRGLAEYIQAFEGTITSAAFKESEAKLAAMPASEALRRVIPIAVYQPQCTHALFSQSRKYGIEGSKVQAEAHGCNLKKDDWKVPATVAAVAGLQLTAPQFASKPDGHFTYGFIEMATGEVRSITKHVGDSVWLTSPLPVQAGDSVAAFPGCDGLEPTCINKFNNIDSYSGFTRVPTKNPLTSSLV